VVSFFIWLYDFALVLDGKKVCTGGYEMTNPNSPFNWRTGEPSIFLRDKDKHKFNGVDSTRSTMHTRAEPRPLYLNSDSVYLQQPKLTRKAPK